MKQPRKKINKYLYGFKLYVMYSDQWEYETFALSMKELKADLKAYQENTNYPVKYNKGREINPEWERLQRDQLCHN